MLRTLGEVNCIYLSENICPPTASPRPFSHSSIARVSDYEGHRPGGRRTYLTTRFPQRIAPKLDLVWPAGLSTEDSLVVAWMEEDFPREEVPKGPFCFPRAPTPKKLRSGVRASVVPDPFPPPPPPPQDPKISFARQGMTLRREEVT